MATPPSSGGIFPLSSTWTSACSSQSSSLEAPPSEVRSATTPWCREAQFPGTLAA
eukprot:CAMPEP_0185188116 /NCGR_PEP_ID=MMETSP1140-20130426/5205_1 /TAXON_ID=298111 /ORGANISM="Pavlova sp., Strain CCMP459" /LENGTH=54 /DNA_ID=CAMNT_0027754599 /DNA_START=348 /DNA_END=509 /DNA_ORIENTATION=-